PVVDLGWKAGDRGYRPLPEEFDIQESIRADIDGWRGAGRRGRRRGQSLLPQNHSARDRLEPRIHRYRLRPRCTCGGVRNEVGGDRNKLVRAVQAEGLPDLAGRECRAVLQRAIVTTQEVVSVSLRRIPTHHPRRWRRARARLCSLALASAPGVDDCLNLGLRQGAIEEFHLVDETLEVEIGGADTRGPVRRKAGADLILIARR